MLFVMCWSLVSRFIKLLHAFDVVHYSISKAWNCVQFLRQVPQFCPKVHKMRLATGLRPDPLGSSRRSPDILAVFGKWKKGQDKNGQRCREGISERKGLGRNREELEEGIGTEGETWDGKSPIQTHFVDPALLGTATEWDLTLSPPIPFRLYILPYWSNAPFLIFDIRALWRSGLSARAPECQKLKMAR